MSFGAGLSWVRMPPCYQLLAQLCYRRTTGTLSVSQQEASVPTFAGLQVDCGSANLGWTQLGAVA